MLYVLDDRRLKVADISNAARPDWAPPVRLEGRGREVLLHRSALLVATTAGLEVFSLDDPLRPRRVLSWPASGGVDDLVPFGSKVLLVQPEAITTMDFGDPAAPRVLASNRVVRALPGVWLLDPEWSWRDLIQRFLPGRRVAHFDGHRLLVGDRFDLAVFEVGGDGTISRLAGSLWRPRWVAGVRQVDGRGYTEDALGAGAVLGISDDGIAELGLHWLDGWVDRTLYRHDRVYRTGACGIEVALDE